MILNIEEINEQNFNEILPELTKPENGGIYDYKFLLKVCKNITDNQELVLIPHIIDRFVTENFELAEWEIRFKVLEIAKEIYAKDVFWNDPDFVKFKLTNYQEIFISKNYPHDKIETLIIPIKLFQESDLAPMEIVVYTLKHEWGKSYAIIAEMLKRDPRTIETTFKRAVFKLSKR